MVAAGDLPIAMAFPGGEFGALVCRGQIPRPFASAVESICPPGVRSDYCVGPQPQIDLVTCKFSGFTCGNALRHRLSATKYWPVIFTESVFSRLS